MSIPTLAITFLGTGTSSGVPMIGCSCNVCTSSNKKDNRLRSSILVQSDSTTIIIDTTPDFRYQMLRSNTKKLDAVLFTHPHKDHIAGLDDVRAYNFFSKKPMDIYANTLTEEAICRDFYYAFSKDKYPGSPNLLLHTINTNSFTIGNIPIQPILVWHLKMPVFGFKIGNFTYITDANRIDDNEKEKIKGSKVLVLNALRKEKHLSHFTLDEAVALSNELQVEKAFFTHISHQLGTHDEVNKQLPNNRQLAYDGLQLVV
ncbi:MAG: MBL fold metallo-hydrolase [Chitinophagaceae bacterium]|nr:MBL fold metallo-hydrolase [Chitinophagaceae bacterium]MCW5904276.1 MBL fold metallo-hydrolase [Chitinophagaceae bacterium]